jgi:import inner membrane translocase subunit TIM8
MDIGSSSAVGANMDLSKLSDRDKQELQQFIVNESQKSRIQTCTTTSILLSL